MSSETGAALILLAASVGMYLPGVVEILRQERDK